MNVVAHYMDGRVLKGASMDLDPGRPICHVTPLGGARVKVELGELKALFVVRSLEGDPRHLELTGLAEGDARRRGAHPVEVTFHDGERLLGLTLHRPVEGERFFLLPADPGSNNVRILVNRGAVASIREGAPAAAARA